MQQWVVVWEGTEKRERGGEEVKSRCPCSCQLAVVMECTVKEGEVKDERVGGGGDGGGLEMVEVGETREQVE